MHAYRSRWWSPSPRRRAVGPPERSGGRATLEAGEPLAPADAAAVLELLHPFFKVAGLLDRPFGADEAEPTERISAQSAPKPVGVLAAHEARPISRDDADLLEVSDAAEAVGVQPDTVRKWCRITAGTPEALAVRVGGRWRVSATRLRKF